MLDKSENSCTRGMERSRSLSLKQLFCIPLKNEVIEEATAPVSVSISQDLQHDGEVAIEPIHEVSSVIAFPPNYTNTSLQHVVKYFLKLSRLCTISLMQYNRGC